MDQITEQLAEALRDLESLAECAMKEANSDGAGYQIGIELEDARAALAAYDAAKARDEQRDPGVCPHGYPQTVRCSRCGE